MATRIPRSVIFVLGQTDEERALFIVFTMRKRRIRVIFARDVPYRSLLKVFLSERIESEIRKHRPRMAGETV